MVIREDLQIWQSDELYSNIPNQNGTSCVQEGIFDNTVKNPLSGAHDLIKHTLTDILQDETPSSDQQAPYTKEGNSQTPALTSTHPLEAKGTILNETVADVPSPSLTIKEHLATILSGGNWHKYHVNQALLGLRPLIENNMLPELYWPLMVRNKLPIEFQQYVEILLYIAITHPRMRTRWKKILSNKQKIGYHDAYVVIRKHLTPEIMRPLEQWITQVSSYLIKTPSHVTGSKNLYKTYYNHWRNHTTDKETKHWPITFLNELITADLLNHFTEPKWYLASDFDDKQLGIDLVCVDYQEAKVALVDLTFQHDKEIIANKVLKIETFETSDMFEKTEFCAHFFDTCNIRNPEIHTAVLRRGNNSFLSAFATYISLIAQGQYQHDAICKHINTPKRARYPSVETKKSAYFQQGFFNFIL